MGLSLEESPQMTALGEGLISLFCDQLIPRDYCLHWFLRNLLSHRKAHQLNTVACTQ